MDYARIVLKLREQIIKFSGELSFGWPKVARRFIADVVYGIQAPPVCATDRDRSFFEGYR